MSDPSNTQKDETDHVATDGGIDSFHDVCDECGRHVAVAGHNPDCPNRSQDTDADHGDER